MVVGSGGFSSSGGGGETSGARPPSLTSSPNSLFVPLDLAD